MISFRWIIRGLGACLLIVCLIGGIDFLQFVSRIDNFENSPAQGPANAVVALTGASDARIQAGVELADNLQLPLLISGVHIDTTEADIATITGVDETEIACCVTLGRAAATTRGNGDEIANWARRFNFAKLIVVTSEYHMDRSLLELQHAMPEGEFLPHAVTSLKVPAGKWLTNPATAKRLFGEWFKYHLARFRHLNDPATPPPPQTDPAENDITGALRPRVLDDATLSIETPTQ